VQPIKSLRGFQGVMLEPSETKHVTIALPASQSSYYDVAAHKFVVAPGRFNVMIVIGPYPAQDGLGDYQLNGRSYVTDILIFPS
jgi:hypothetical protein